MLKGVVNTLPDGVLKVSVFALKYKNKAVDHGSKYYHHWGHRCDSNKIYTIPLDVYYAKQGTDAVTSRGCGTTKATLQAAYNE